MSEDKTHYRKAFNSPYLSSADIVEPTLLTIKNVKLESDQTHKTKDSFNTAYFAESEIRPGEKLKPMILNGCNSRTMKDLAGSHYIDDWNNISVTIYVDPNVRFGRDTVEGLRISTVPADKKKPELSPDDIKKWTRAIKVFQKDGNLDAVEKHMTVSKDHAELIKEQANAHTD